MWYWEELADRINGGHSGEGKAYAEIIGPRQDSQDRVEVKLPSGTLTISSKYIELNPSHNNHCETVFVLTLNKYTDLSFSIEQSTIYERIWISLFGKKNTFLFSGYVVESKHRHVTIRILEDIDFDKHEISHMTLKVKDQKNVLSMVSHEEFAKSQNAEQYIELIEGLAQNLLS